ncbi:MAG: translation initiation factor IF-2 subunit alpha [Candidatus Altiarchaeota archaeon]|nr:translation initiation factor IF-2 subunit alpha [Candidatus Altiarchaeota archaeon]
MYPNEGEFILGTVQSLFKQGAFITLDEYPGKRGMLPLSEISLKWVRNIRDYVKEGQKVVLLVLRVDPERGHIDLSLRRVNDAQRKQKLQDIKQEQRTKKILEMVAAELKVSFQEISTKVTCELTLEYPSIYKALEAITLDKAAADRFKIPDKWKAKLVEITCKSIKPPYVEINGYVELHSYEPDGIDVIKESLQRMSGNTSDAEIGISYISAPIYRIHVKARDYKTAEKALQHSADLGIAYVEEKHGTGEFHRELKKQ